MRTLQDLRRDEEELRILRGRSSLISSILFILFIIGLFKIFQLTILDRADYEVESDKNRIITLPIFPSRGLIKLSDGTIVAENIVSHGIYIESRLFDKAQDQIGTLFEEILNEELNLKIVPKDLKKDLKIWLAQDLTAKELAKYELFKNQLPDLKLETTLKRHLPHGNLFSHVIGHLGKIDQQERLLFSKNEYSNSSLIGKVGIEKKYENFLKGSNGISIVEVDVYGNKIREINRIMPNRPSDLVLTLDLELQKVSKEELSGRRGAVVAIEPSTGYVKALVSSPDYNPNFINGSETGKLLLDFLKEDAPFFNRAISGSYPPASTLKPFIALLGLEQEVINAETIVEDIGFFQLKEDGRRYRGWKEDGHGKVDLKKAIVESSDVYFYDLASKLTIDRISSFLSKFGFGRRSGIDLVNESESILPTRNWKLGNIGESWFVGDTINIGIGQGYITSTPLQLAASVSAIANKGPIFQPKLVAYVGENKQQPMLLNNVQLEDKKNWKIIEDSMISVIQSWNGTAHNLYEENGILIAGKTGTAQIKSLVDQELSVREEYEGVRQDIKNRDHALFASYGPIPNPNLVVVVIVENGESGSTVAAPIAKKIIERHQINIKNAQ